MLVIMTVLSLAFFATILQSTNLQDSAYSLQWKPEKGAKSSFLLNVVSLSKEDPMEMEVALTQVVLKVDEDGYEAETTNNGALIRFGGEEMRDTRTTKTEVEYTKRGAVKELMKGFNKGGEDPWLFALIRAFVAPDSPVKVGGGWQYEYKPKDTFAGARLSYTLKSVENGMATVDFAVNGIGRERPELGKGVWIVDAKTGALQSMTCHVANLFGSGEAGASITLKRN